MEEFRNYPFYKPGDMVEADILSRSKKYSHPLIGHITKERCPQCSARLFANEISEWCWNCNWENNKRRKVK